MKILEGANLAVRFALELSAIAATALALAAAGQGTLAVVFAVVAAISGTLNYVWDSAPNTIRPAP